MKRGDIYLVSLDPTFGHEQQGTRPVLIVSSDRFNAVTRVANVLPITTGGDFARTRGFAIPVTGFGLRTVGVDQLQTIDLSARGAKYLESAPPVLVKTILDALQELFTY